MPHVVQTAPAKAASSTLSSFALTGDISRLAGAGTGGLSVKSHGPHVDSRNEPEIASVTLDVIIPALRNKKAQIRRTVKAAKKPQIRPADKDISAAFDIVGLHPEFAALSLRADPVRRSPNRARDRKRAKPFSAWTISQKLRGVLQKIANACTRELPGYTNAPSPTRSQGEFPSRSRHSTAHQYNSFPFRAVNLRRELLGLALLSDLRSQHLCQGRPRGPAHGQRLRAAYRRCRPPTIWPLFKTHYGHSCPIRSSRRARRPTLTPPNLARTPKASADYRARRY